MTKDIGSRPIGAMTTDTLLRTLKQIVSKETEPLYRKISALEVENRNLRARINAPGGGSVSGSFQKIRRP